MKYLMIRKEKRRAKMKTPNQSILDLNQKDKRKNKKYLLLSN